MADAKTALVFPGQGSQKVGMGDDLFHNSEPAKVVFKQADERLGFNLSRLCFEGPDEELRKTINAQPALVAMSLACYQAALAVSDRSRVKPPALVAGHSLGEYTALAVAGVLSFGDAIFLARERGRLMHEAGQITPGAMAAILGLDEAAVKALCAETGTWLANINCPGQLVISGARENIAKAIALAPSRGASRALPLQVSGAFHTPLMQPAADGLAETVNCLTFANPSCPVVANTTARPLTDPASIKEELLKQLCNPVQWQGSVEYMIAQGVTTFIEIGAGRVLNGLIKRIHKNVAIFNIGELAELNNLERPL
jgi:[acyl-carrier-protein] S-malonyltransferase